jgi:hypothetical protein
MKPLPGYRRRSVVARISSRSLVLGFDTVQLFSRPKSRDLVQTTCELNGSQMCAIPVRWTSPSQGVTKNIKQGHLGMRPALSATGLIVGFSVAVLFQNPSTRDSGAGQHDDYGQVAETMVT